MFWVEWVSRLRLFAAAYLAGALIDDVLTYLYVKLWGMYAEANPVIVMFWLDKPLWLWILRELFGLILAVAASVAYRRLADILIGRAEKPSPRALRLLTAMRRAWMWPLALAAVIRCLPAIHNILLIAFGYESPLSELVRRMFTPSFLGSALITATVASRYT